MIKRTFFSVIIAMIMLCVPFISGMSDIMQWGAQQAFSIFLSSPCSNFLLKPLENGTKSLFEDTSKNSKPSSLRLFFRRYMPSFTSSAAALGAYGLASSQGYNHWITKSLVFGALASRLSHLLLPSVNKVTYKHNDILNKLLKINSSSNAYKLLSERRMSYFSPGAYALNALGVSTSNIENIDKTLKESTVAVLLADKFINMLVSRLI